MTRILYFAQVLTYLLDIFSSIFTKVKTRLREEKRREYSYCFQGQTHNKPQNQLLSGSAKGSLGKWF